MATRHKQTTQYDVADDFNPAPSILQGGIARLVRCWESCRDNNAGGYGSGVVQAVSGWHPAGKRQITSCSPFTATVIGMIFDGSGKEAVGTTFEPYYNNRKDRLPGSFYALHNGAYFEKDKHTHLLTPRGALRHKRFVDRQWPLTADGAEGSLLFFNLGYLIDPKDMRRGDLVKIEWANLDGHATFCWDVHLNEKKEVDCFQFLSANSGPGVSVGCSKANYRHFLTQNDDGSWHKKLNPLFSDQPEYIKYGKWMCLPGVLKESIKRETFKDPSPTSIADQFADHGWGAKKVTVVRFWGVAPPEREQTSAEYTDAFAAAKSLALEKAPESYATGKGSAVATSTIHIPDVPVTKVKGSEIAKDPGAARKAPPRPVRQPDDRSASHQHFVEDALKQLHEAGWIDKDPGDPKSINDAQTKAAIEDFQKKFGIRPADGTASPVTRKILSDRLDDLRAGRPNPNASASANGGAKAPRIDHIYWLRNRVDVGATNYLAVHGVNLDLIQSFRVFLKDLTSGREEGLTLPIVAVRGEGGRPLAMPNSFGLGSVVVARVEGKSSDGSKIEKTSDVPVFIGPLRPEPPPVLQPPDNDWPWDESKWPKQMRDIMADLRATKAPDAGFEPWEITQYGVKEKLQAGDCPVRSPDGQVFGSVTRRSLMLADIEGTMRLHGRILNIAQKGNVYEPKEILLDDGTHITKNKPVPEKFDPARSLWHDVTDGAPWGKGAKLSLLPFRTLAVNPHKNKALGSLYYRKVYIRQLDGMTLPTGERHNGICIVGDCGGMHDKHFDFFVGREDRHVTLPSARRGKLTFCDLVLLDECAIALPRSRRRK